MFLYSSIAEAGDSFVRCPLHTGTKSVSRLLLLCLPCTTGEYLNSRNNYDIYLAKGLLREVLVPSEVDSPEEQITIHTYSTYIYIFDIMNIFILLNQCQKTARF